MKLTTTTHVSVDGVMQGISRRDEDRSGGFDRGGWTTPLWDNEARTYVSEVYQRADAFLFGRRTYEIFAGSWGAVADPGINPIAKALNTMPKYVASTTLTGVRRSCSPRVETRHRWQPYWTGSVGRCGRPATSMRGLCPVLHVGSGSSPYCRRPAGR